MEEQYIDLALTNIVKHGDTDIFPFPIENHIFYDKKKEVTALLKKINSNFAENLETSPPVNITTCSPLGYVGFRWATLVDPIWNAYFLSLVLSLADKIESRKIPVKENTVFSYRFKPDFEQGYLFDTGVNWLSFQNYSYETVKKSDCKYVVSCDIADFYNRIYHPKLESALRIVDPDTDTPGKIMEILKRFSGFTSYGLPIGGPAARILAELALTGIDRILKMDGIRFCRYVDDFHIFARTYDEAHSTLNRLVIKLLKNEGLTLQKHKTQVLTKTEFKNLVESRISAETRNEKERERARFMSLPIPYDPYSKTKDEDYHEIKSHLEEFDVMGLLYSELRKSRIHQQFCIKLIKSFKFINEKVLSEAFIAMSEKIDRNLYPIFPNIMITAFTNFDRLNELARKVFIGKLKELIEKDSYVVQVEINAAYLLKVLAREDSPENENIVHRIYKKFSESIMIKSLVIQIMARWKVQPWLADLKPDFQKMSKWERRIFIIASYILGYEGQQFREANQKMFSDFERLVSQWASKKVREKTGWEIPL